MERRLDTPKAELRMDRCRRPGARLGEFGRLDLGSALRYRTRLLKELLGDSGNYALEVTP